MTATEATATAATPTRGHTRRAAGGTCGGRGAGRARRGLRGGRRDGQRDDRGLRFGCDGLGCSRLGRRGGPGSGRRGYGGGLGCRGVVAPGRGPVGWARSRGPGLGSAGSGVLRNQGIGELFRAAHRGCGRPPCGSRRRTRVPPAGPRTRGRAQGRAKLPGRGETLRGRFGLQTEQVAAC